MILLRNAFLLLLYVDKSRGVEFLLVGVTVVRQMVSWTSPPVLVLVASWRGCRRTLDKKANLKMWNDQLTLTGHRAELQLLFPFLARPLFPLKKSNKFGRVLTKFLLG